MLCKCEHVNDVSSFGGTEGVLAVQVQRVPAQNSSQGRLVNDVNKVTVDVPFLVPVAVQSAWWPCVDSGT